MTVLPTVWQSPRARIFGETRTYRPELDGVRGLAIALVLIGHLVRPQLIGAGYVGVGIFFVLSGYLITGVLRRESLRTFYARRIARLAPALLVTVVAVALVAPGVALIPTLAYVANWQVAGVLPGSSDLGPLGHTWSLSIEEQFYLVWPFVLPLIWKRPGLILALAVVAAELRFFMPDWLGYFATFTRVDGLLLGAWILLAGIRLRWTWPALVLVALTCLGGAEPTPVMLAAVTVAGGLLVAAPPRVLLPLAPLGRISYALYLYQWPLVTWLGGPVGTVVAIAAAWLSTRYLEEPVRRWVRSAHQPVGDRAVHVERARAQRLHRLHLPLELRRADEGVD